MMGIRLTNLTSLAPPFTLTGTGLDEAVVNYNQSGYVSEDIYQTTISLDGIGVDTEVIAAQGDWNQIQVLGMLLTSDTDSVFAIVSGGAKIMKFAVKANKPFSLHTRVSERPIFGGNYNSNISIMPFETITKGRLYIQYKIRQHKYV